MKPSEMSLRYAQAEIATAVYRATGLIEELEGVGKVSGSGHHARQKVAQAAADELERRWIEDTTS